jgi:hypothetical protein
MLHAILREQSWITEISCWAVNEAKVLRSEEEWRHMKLSRDIKLERLTVHLTVKTVASRSSSTRYR